MTGYHSGSDNECVQPDKAIWLIAVTSAIAFATVAASDRRGAEITALKGEVKTEVNGVTGNAVANALLTEGASIQTGADSWVELRFGNLGLARLGPNSSFSFQNGSRRLTLREGSVLVQLPKGAHGARLEGDRAAAVVAGTTAVFDCQPNVFKFFVLEGTARFFRPGHLGDSVLIPPGRMIIGQPGAALTDPVDFEIDRFLKTSRFLTDFQTLETSDRIAREAARQKREEAKGILRPTNLAIFGAGTSVSVLDSGATPAPADEKTGATPPPPMREAAPTPIDRAPLGR